MNKFRYLLTLLFITCSTLAFSNDSSSPNEWNKMELHLINYLKGTWHMEGQWQVEDGNGSRPSNATISGTETYDLVLNKRFLQKTFNGQVTYVKPDTHEEEEFDFSAMTLFVFNPNHNDFSYWYFDSFGEVMEASGDFDTNDKNYKFSSQTLDSKGDMIQTLYILKPLDSNKFEWIVKEKRPDAGNWSVAARGTTIRK